MSWFKTPQLRNISSYVQTLCLRNVANRDWWPVVFCWCQKKVFPSKSSLFPEMHHVWENVLDGALMVGDEATFGLQQHVNSSVSTGKSIASFIFVPTEAARRWGWVFSFLSLIAGRPLKEGFMEWATIYHSLQAASHFFANDISHYVSVHSRVTKCFRARVWH